MTPISASHKSPTPIVRYETFAYNGWGEVTSHRLRSGGVETFNYDARGMKTSYLPPATPSDPNPSAHPTYFYYDAFDRLSQVTDPRGSNTWFAYNARGQILRITHQDNSFALAAYNTDGTLASTTDELNHTTSYSYDYFKRLTSSVNPLHQTTTINYTRWSTSSSYFHTAAFPFITTLPSGKQTHLDCDWDFRKTIVRQAPGTADDAYTYLYYDAVGDLTSIKDPRGNVTTFDYDARYRRISKTDPAPFASQVTRWDYDATGNMTKVTRPNSSYATTSYDAMNRVTDTYGFGNEHTHFQFDSAGNVTQLVDPKNATYAFAYDVLNRKTSETYPPDIAGLSRTETWHYNFAGALDQYKNPANQTQTLTYDSRNRLTNSSWSNSVSPPVIIGYDAANRVSSVNSNNSETVLAYGYDDANRPIWEDQTVSGLPTRRVQHERDVRRSSDEP